ncbi:MAG: cytochrome-c oxidase, cbb3-type subunit III [Marinicaulis sp.]|nr:cytochrome-c oxidase, cbb3-type subunit III [Marinicaulis sp.]NNE41445.1 cytochrome-c oxidase, cbb3-type subunit III [Marinicaulis sp.]NNL89232.1 cytochrome-c oxidase, cbb3-type subunit III [Marinicaulis sp.]
MSEKEVDEHSGVETTGHEWDGIKELNNPLPRWWLIVFWVSVIWSIGYWIFMPAWPGITGYTKGIRNHSERENVAVAIEALDAARADDTRRLIAAPSMEAIENDPDLLQFAMAAGGSLFGDNCATCHGAGGQGFKGYPNLNDDVWLWGGSLEEIKDTITVGRRSEHPETTNTLMMAYGRDGLLPRDDITALVDYVRMLSGQDYDAEAASRAAPIYATQCIACHGANGRGDKTQGAPDLTDAIWLYGGDRRSIYDTIWNGRAGVMPAWEGRLSEEEIIALSVYVHALGGGE